MSVETSSDVNAFYFEDSQTLFDRFETSDGLSLAVEVTLQPSEKSFTDAELADISKRIVAAAEKLGARLRT